MKIKKTAFIFGGVVASAVAVSLLVGCGGKGGDSKEEEEKGYNVTYHATAGHKINNVENFTATNVLKVDKEPGPQPFKGEKFAGWYDNASYEGYKVTFPLTISSNTELYAKWVPDSSQAFNVSFDSNGGTKVPTYLIKVGDTVEASPTTNKEGCKLLGWKTSSTSDYVSFPFKPSEDTSLVADWEKISHKALFHTTGSKPVNTNEYSENVYQSKEDSKVIQTAPYSTKANYSFAGWYSTPDYKQENLVTFPHELTNENENLYAKFTPTREVNVILHDDLVSEPKTLENCTSVPYAPAPIAINDKKKFEGWATSSGGLPITDYSVYTDLNSDLDLYAVWSEKDKQTITFFAEDKITPIKTVEYCKGDKILEAPSFDELQRDYYDFYGWRDLDVQDNPYVSFPIYSIEKNYRVFAHCVRSSFDVEIRDSEFDGKANELVIKPYSKKSSITLPSTISYPDPERAEDYKFLNYYYYDGETKVTLPTESYTLDLSTAASKLDKNNNKFIIYANWDQTPGSRNYKITINYGDGVSDFIKVKDRILVSDLPDRSAQETHRTLIHYLDEDGNIYKDNDLLPREEEHLRDITLTAVWKSNQRTLKVHRGGAEKPKEYTEEEVTIQSSEVDPSTEEIVFRYKNIPVNTESKTKFTLNSFYIDNPLTTADPRWLYLEDVIESDITEVWEKWDLAYTDVDISYIDNEDRTNVIQTDKKVNLMPRDYIYGHVKTVITDYDVVSMELNDEEVTLSDPIDNTSLDFGKTHYNILKVYVTKTKFTVTYKSQCPTDTHEDKIAYHQTNVDTSDAYQPAKSSSPRCLFKGWYYESGCVTPVESKQKLTNDITVYGKWEWDPQKTISATFNVGSTQMLAKFSDDSKEKVVVRDNLISEEDFPAATCEGCIFDGWYDSEIGGTKYTSISETGKTLYAHWTPLSGYLSICLDLGEGGTFTKTGSQSTLMTIAKNTLWGSLKDKVPECTYEKGEYTVSNWSADGTTGLLNTYKFTDQSPKFLSPIVAENIKTPSSFANDNWATLIAVAENKVTDQNGSNYSNGFEALKAKYNADYKSSTGKSANTFVGLTRPLGYGDYVVRVIGEGHDYSESSSSKKLPLTFEVVKLFDVSAYNESSVTASSWTGSDIYKKLQSGGTFFKLMPNILKSHFATTYKYTSNSGKEANKMFIPSGYEIGASTTKIGSESKYSLYSTSSYQFKELGSVGCCCYWLRNVTSPYQAGYYPVYMNVDFNAGVATKCYWQEGSTALAERGVDVMFCIGTGYSKW